MITIHKDTKILQTYLEKQKEGKELSFLKIEYDTKIRMDTEGKAHLRSALYRANIEYISIYGTGIKLVAPETSVECISQRFSKIDNAVRRGSRTNNNIIDQFIDKVNEDDRGTILLAGSVPGAMRASAKNYRIRASKNRPNQKPSIPEYVPKY